MSGLNDFRTVQEKVKAAFDVFDKEGKGCVIVEYICLYSSTIEKLVLSWDHWMYFHLN